MRNADSEANKAITKKFNDLDQRVKAIDDEYAAYVEKVNVRQLKRTQVADRLNNSIDDEKLLLVQRKKDEMATRLHTHVLDEQGLAVVEAGLRERTKLQVGKPGTEMGEVWRNMMQFKAFPMAFLMRHGSRALAQSTLASKAWYAASLLGTTTILGGLVVQLKELAKGNDPMDMTEIDFFQRALVAGGGLSILGDLLAAGAGAAGQDTSDYLTGPFGRDLEDLTKLTVGDMRKLANDQETHIANDVFKIIKNKTPGQNLWYTKAVIDRLLFDQIQDIIAPGYREKLLRQAERERGQTRWLGNFNYGSGFDEFRAPDFEKAVR